MLELVQNEEEAVYVSLPITKRQIAGLFYREVQTNGTASEDLIAAEATTSRVDKATRLAKKLLTLADKRRSFFDRRFFDDPSWHALLDLYVQESEGRLVSISSACVGTLAAATTALRHIENLTMAGILERIPDPDDKRRVWIGLSRETRERMTDLLNLIA